MKLFAKYRYISDQQFVADLLADDEKALECLLYDRFRRLLRFNAMKAAPNVPLDDLVQEFYLYLQADGWARLRRYDPSLPFDRWLSVVSYRFFKDFSLQMIDSRRQIPITQFRRPRIAKCWYDTDDPYHDGHTTGFGPTGASARPRDTDRPAPSGRGAADSGRPFPSHRGQPL
ncbi:MAG: sigma-70 family RNA polymerase sigma factor [Bacteroidales bacterium]|nr:sigma-70 family RNA polymerase sigma factor [Bacteroidales bacterium]